MPKQKVNSSLNNQAFKQKVKMCSKMSSKAVKVLVGLVILGLAGVISLAVYFGSGQANASVTLQGDHNQSKLSQSAGIHVLEINN